MGSSAVGGGDGGGIGSEVVLGIVTSGCGGSSMKLSISEEDHKFSVHGVGLCSNEEGVYVGEYLWLLLFLSECDHLHRRVAAY